MTKWTDVADNTYLVVIIYRESREVMAGVCNEQTLIEIYDESGDHSTSVAAYKIDKKTGELRKVRRVVKIELTDTVE